MALVGKDLRQIHRHGLVALLVLTFVFLFIGSFLFNSTADQLEKQDDPGWTDQIVPPEDPADDVHVEVSADVHSGVAPLTVNFDPVIVNADKAEGTIQYSWDFGDGNTSTRRGQVSHTYELPGHYQCILNVSDDTGESLEAQPVPVVVAQVNDTWFQAICFANRTDGAPPLSVQFRAVVVGGVPPYTYSWDFGDGTSSEEADPVHEFEEAREYEVRLHVEDSDTNATDLEPIYLEVEEPGEGLPFTLLDLMFGFSVLVTMIVLPVAFSSCYKHEMRRGTVRTLVVYPVGPLEVTLAKLVYAAIVGFVFTLVIVLLPSGSIDMPRGEAFQIYVTAYFLSLVTVAIGALGALALARVVKRMVFRPTSLPYLFVILAFVFTETILWGLMTLIDMFTGGGMDVDAFVAGWAPVIAMSPYHIGGVNLFASLGGGGEGTYAVLVVPVLLVLVGMYLAKGVYPDIFEKE